MLWKNFFLFLLFFVSIKKVISKEGRFFIPLNFDFNSFSNLINSSFLSWSSINSICICISLYSLFTEFLKSHLRSVFEYIINSSQSLILHWFPECCGLLSEDSRPQAFTSRFSGPMRPESIQFAALCAVHWGYALPCPSGGTEPPGSHLPAQEPQLTPAWSGISLRLSSLWEAWRSSALCVHPLLYWARIGLCEANSLRLAKSVSYLWWYAHQCVLRSVERSRN